MTTTEVAAGDRAVRLAVLGLSHEANSFATRLVDRAMVGACGLLRGQTILARHAGGSSTMAGYLSIAELPGVELVPLVSSMLVPAGPFTRGCYETCAQELLEALSEHGPFDGVLADLHGAAVAEHLADVDGELLRRMRELLGTGVPIGVSLDLHANISAQMCQFATVLNCYRTNPHVDAHLVAREIAELVIRTARGQIRPTMAFEPLPAVINMLCQNTDTEPMTSILHDLQEVRNTPGVLSASVAQGYPYGDVPELGMSVVVVTDDDPKGAARHALRLAEQVWARRADFTNTAPDADQAIAQAVAAEATRTPVLLLDVGDNIGGGAPGDSVVLLQAARRAGLQSLLIIVADPGAAADCHAAGTGARLTLSVGGHTDPETGPPVHASATVLALHDGLYRTAGPVHAGMRDFDAGPSAAVRLDTGQTVILTSRPTLPLSPDQLTTLGLRPQEFSAIVAKGVNSPLAGYGPHVAQTLLVDTPGVTGADLSRFIYRHRRRPLFPFEPDAPYPPAQTATDIQSEFEPEMMSR